MFWKYFIFICVLLVFINGDPITMDHVTSATPPTLNIDSIKKNMAEFRECIDKSLASAVGDVNENHLQPIFTVIGDHLNRLSRAYDELTGARKESIQ